VELEQAEQETRMPRNLSFVRACPMACILCLLLSSAAWAAAVNVHVNVPVVHPKVTVVNVKSNVPNTANTTGGGTIGSTTGGAGAGKAELNQTTITKATDSASPSFFKPDGSGKETNYYTIKLTNGAVASYHTYHSSSQSGNGKIESKGRIH
jgi:hypothetical protein